MKKLIRYSFLLLLVVTGNTSHAQKLHSNSVKLMSGSFVIPGRQQATLRIKQIGLAYERKVFRNFFIGAAYHRWTNIGNKYTPIAVFEPEQTVNKKDGLTARYNYKMVDVNLLYKYQVGKGHVINAGIGASYCTGSNTYWDNPRLQDPALCLILFRQQKESYYGIVPQLSYDYSFLNNHLSAGIDLRARYYTGRAPGQYDYGVHVGVNF